MIEFNELFDSHDPFGSYATSLCESPIVRSRNERAHSTREICNLSGGDQDSVFKVLMAHADGVDLRSSVLHAAHSNAWLVDVFEAFELACANLSLEAPDLDLFRDPELIQEQCCLAVDACVAAEAARCLSGAELGYPLPDHHQALRTVLHIPISKLRLATFQLNELPIEQRLPIMRVFLQGVPPGEVVIETQRSFADIVMELKNGLSTLRGLGLSQDN